MAIHQNLKELRSASNMTQEQVAAQLNVTRQTISSYESGRTRPDIDTLARLAELYGASLEDILYGQSTMVSRTRWLRFCQWGTVGLLAALVLLRSVLMCANNRIFPLADGAAADRTVMETHVQISELWESLDGLALAVSLIGFVLLLCLAAVALLCRRVFARGCALLSEKQCSCELLTSLAALASAVDCAAVLLLPSRTAVTPYAVVSCWALTFAMWGGSRASRGDWEMFRTVSLDDDPPYLVTETERGACKQKGSIPGFYTTAQRTDLVRVWQAVLLPVVLAASVVFAGLSSLGQGRGADFLLNWSAILSAGATFSLPLCWGIPWSRLARHLQKIGCAVAGWSGAERISRRRAMILTDADLFPPGTMQLNGVKVFGEELPKAASYAATLARCAGSGLHRLFDGLLRSECGRYEEADDFSFYEEGGYSANIHGETVLLGTASFMRKMEVRMPGNIHLKTGLFLAVDHQLTAAFAVKYNASENVDYALRMMKRSRITPILAARDPNITPALLKRKFHKGVKVEYPDLTTRVALSEAEQDRGMPRALLLREGLLPYASTVVGSRRLCRAVRRASVLSFFSSAAGLLLSFYLTFSRAYDLIGPLALLVFLLLWTAPVLLMGDWTGRY